MSCLRWAPLVSAAVASIMSVAALPAQGPQAARSAIEQNKDLIVRFFTLANAGDVAGLRTIVAEDYVEHADMLDFREGLLSVTGTNPHTPITAAAAEERRRIRGTIVRMIAEHDEVWTFSEVRGSTARVGRLDMFRVDRGRVAEHWAIAEDVVEQRRNANDNFAMGRGPQQYATQPTRVTTATAPAVLERNKEVARLFYHYNQMADLAEGLRRRRGIIREDYIQHNASIMDGREAFLTANMSPERIARVAAGQRETSGPGANRILRMLAEGDLVWVLIGQPDLSRGQVNQYRLQDGMVAEQWGVYQPAPMPGTKQNTNTFLGYSRGPAMVYRR